jgi:hypothetical protein
MGSITADTKKTNFTYATDPLCLGAIAVYFLNKFFIKTITHDPSSFIHCYLNDCLLIPATLPIALLLTRAIRSHRSRSCPSAITITIYWGIGTLVFELIGPNLISSWVFDPFDILAYAAGGTVAWAYWNAPFTKRSCSELFRDLRIRKSLATSCLQDQKHA